MSVEKPHWFEWRITFGNILTILVFLCTIAIGWGQLKAQMEYITENLHSHQVYDDKRFADMASKDSREMRDRWVDQQFSDIKEQLRVIVGKLPAK